MATEIMPLPTTHNSTTLTLAANSNEQTRKFLLSLLPENNAKRYLTQQDLRQLMAERSVVAKIVLSSAQVALLLQTYENNFRHNKQASFLEKNKEQKIKDLKKQQEQLVAQHYQLQLQAQQRQPSHSSRVNTPVETLSDSSIDLTPEQLLFIIKAILSAVALSCHTTVTMTILAEFYRQSCEKNFLYQINQLTKKVAEDFSKHFRTHTLMPEPHAIASSDSNPYHNNLTSIATPVPTRKSNLDPLENASAPPLEEANSFSPKLLPITTPSTSTVMLPQTQHKTSDQPTADVDAFHPPELKLPIAALSPDNTNYPGLYYNCAPYNGLSFFLAPRYPDLHQPPVENEQFLAVPTREGKFGSS